MGWKRSSFKALKGRHNKQILLGRPFRALKTVILYSIGLCPMLRYIALSGLENVNYFYSLNKLVLFRNLNHYMRRYFSYLESGKNIVIQPKDIQTNVNCVEKFLESSRI